MVSIQEQMNGNYCYGCGPDNELGMRIKSYWSEGECVCRYTPKPEQCAGPKQYVYGGTIASLIDCHCIGTAVFEHHRREGREMGSTPDVWCVTGKLTVDYLAPTPINEDIVLRARVLQSGDKKSVIQCRVFSGDLQTAEGEVIAIRVPDSWRDSSPE